MKIGLHLPRETREDLRHDAFESDVTMSEIVTEMVRILPKKFRQYLRYEAKERGIEPYKVLVQLLEARVVKFTERKPQ